LHPDKQKRSIYIIHYWKGVISIGFQQQNNNLATDFITKNLLLKKYVLKKNNILKISNEFFITNMLAQEKYQKILLLLKRKD
jgi:hypothetical protein